MNPFYLFSIVVSEEREQVNSLNKNRDSLIFERVYLTYISGTAPILSRHNICTVKKSLCRLLYGIWVNFRVTLPPPGPFLPELIH